MIRTQNKRQWHDAWLFPVCLGVASVFRDIVVLEQNGSNTYVAKRRIWRNLRWHLPSSKYVNTFFFVFTGYCRTVMMTVWMLHFQWECLRCFPLRTPICLFYKMLATWCPWLNKFCTTWFRMVSRRYKNWGWRGREQSAPARAPLGAGSVVWITDSNVCPRLYPPSEFGNVPYIFTALFLLLENEVS